MNTLKLACLITCLTLCLAVFGGLINQQTVLAQEEKIELSAKYPVRPGPSDTVFDFAVELSYTGGDEPLTFDLFAEGPEGWAVSIRQSAFEDKEISAILLDPTKSYPDTIAVVAMAPFWLYPDPGDYLITLKAASGEIEGSVDLTARITARYNFAAMTKNERLNIKTTAGKGSDLTVIITNTGTDSLDKVTFSSLDPRGIAGQEWSTTFNPEEIESLSPGHEQEIMVTVKPPSKTIAGDYMVTLRFLSDPTPSQGPSSLDIRVTVGTSTAWGWIGAGIVIAVIAGLYFIFRRFGRR